MKLSQSELDTLQVYFSHEEIEFAVLFGSFATGNATEESDIDVAIQFKSSNPQKNNYIRDKLKGSWRGEREVDILILNSYSNSSVLRTISATGVFLSGNLEKALSFCRLSIEDLKQEDLVGI